MINDQIKDSLNGLSNLFRQQFYKLKQSNYSAHTTFLQDENIWEIFPYIKYENDPNTKILLGTVQKFCRGFFDGRKKRKLLDIKDKIIFLDEFDFLEQEILDALCKSAALNRYMLIINYL